MSTEEYTPNCRCKKGEIRTYLRYENTLEGTLIVDHEPAVRQSENDPEQLPWKGGLCIERRYKVDGHERNDFVVLDFSEVERVRNACNAFLHDHTL